MPEIPQHLQSTPYQEQTWQILRQAHAFLHGKAPQDGFDALLADAVQETIAERGLSAFVMIPGLHEVLSVIFFRPEEVRTPGEPPV